VYDDGGVKRPRRNVKPAWTVRHHETIVTELVGARGLEAEIRSEPECCVVAAHIDRWIVDAARGTRVPPPSVACSPEDRQRVASGSPQPDQLLDLKNFPGVLRIYSR
jgi:hypothetical protein